MAQAQTLSPEQFAELQRRNPQLAAELMASGAGNTNSGGSGSAAAALMDWLGADGMPTRVSAKPQAPMREQNKGKSDRGVPTDAPQPPMRNTRPNAASPIDDISKTDVEGDTARTNARAGGGRASTGVAKADGPTARETDKSATRTAVAAAPPPRPSMNDMRIAEEIFGPPMPQGMNADIPASAIEGSTNPNVGLPDDVAMSAAAAGGQTPIGGIVGSDEDVAADVARIKEGGAPAQPPPVDTSWRERVGQVLGSPKIALREAGIDYDALPFAERNMITQMGPEKWLASQRAARFRRPTRQQMQR